MKLVQCVATAVLLTTVLFAGVGAEAQQAAPAGPTLSAVRARGVLVCGTSTGFAGFSVMDSQGRNRGLDADLCVALAAAVFGDPARIRWERLAGRTCVSPVGMLKAERANRGAKAVWDAVGSAQGERRDTRPALRQRLTPAVGTRTRADARWILEGDTA